MTERNKKILNLIKSVPGAPIPSDDYVAKLLAEEAARRKRQLQIPAFDDNSYESKDITATSINKTFLSNMIRDVDSHNRREEISDCWRQHTMMKRSSHADLQQTNRTDPSKPMHKRLRTEHSVNTAAVVQSSDTNLEAERQRQYWAMKKLEKLATTGNEKLHNESQIVDVDNNSNSSDSSRDNDSSSKVKKNKKKKSQKHDKKKKKKLKKSKDKHDKKDKSP